MLNVISIVIGAVALLPALLALIPLFGWMNWFIIPVAVVGLLLGLASRSNTGRNLNLAVLAICVLRLILGGGIF